MVPEGSHAAIEATNLRKKFGEIEVANDINLRLESGARHALIGPNGAGKTTFVNLLTDGPTGPDRIGENLPDQYFAARADGS
jgi:ABC-type branched-subunit amino acid transport system ATPase component